MRSTEQSAGIKVGGFCPRHHRFNINDISEKINSNRCLRNFIFFSRGQALNGSSIFKCILITNSEETVLDCEGIRIEVIPIWK